MTIFILNLGSCVCNIVIGSQLTSHSYPHEENNGHLKFINREKNLLRSHLLDIRLATATRRHSPSNIPTHFREITEK